MQPPPPDEQTWVGLVREALPLATIDGWVGSPDCGAVVTFKGVVRDHAEGRAGVETLSYEAYEEQATVRMSAVVDEARRRWPAVRRVAVLHRTGDLVVGDDAVVVAVASPHRGDAFAAAAYCIDTVKATAPIWKRETWSEGSGWGTDATAPVDLADLVEAGIGGADGAGREDGAR